MKQPLEQLDLVEKQHFYVDLIEDCQSDVGQLASAQTVTQLVASVQAYAQLDLDRRQLGVHLAAVKRPVVVGKVDELELPHFEDETQPDVSLIQLDHVNGMAGDFVQSDTQLDVE